MVKVIIILRSVVEALFFETQLLSAVPSNFTLRGQYVE
jgi:hypothetical protein